MFVIRGGSKALSTCCSPSLLFYDLRLSASQKPFAGYLRDTFCAQFNILWLVCVEFLNWGLRHQCIASVGGRDQIIAHGYAEAERMGL